jgi:hypothetical protein
MITRGLTQKTFTRIARHNYSSFWSSFTQPAPFTFTESFNVASNVFLSQQPSAAQNPFIDWANNVGFKTLSEFFTALPQDVNLLLIDNLNLSLPASIVVSTILLRLALLPLNLYSVS